jgi:phage FluMu protein Com
MRLSLKEGDDVTLPCRHCASLSLRVVIRKGTTRERCPKCHKLTTFTILEGPEGLDLQTVGPSSNRHAPLET